MARVGLGVIGLGRMGQVYGYHAARQIEAADLVAVADSLTEATTTFSERVGGVQTYSTYQDLLANPDIHGVIVATPTSTHRDVVIAAAEAGKAIFCEKPTALTLAATDEMIAAVEKARVLFQVGFMRRFDRAYMQAKQQIEAGIIGDPASVRALGRDAGRTSLEFANPRKSGGLVLDMGIHDFDAIRWLMNDEFDRVYTEASALVYPELLDVDDVDTAVITVRFARGGLGNVEVSRTGTYGYDIQCEIVGSKGSLRIGYLQETPLVTLTKDGLHHDIVPHFPERFGDAYTAQIEHFVDCLVNDTQPKVSSADARAALQVSIAAYTSQLEERVVKVADVQDPDILK